MIPAQPTGYGNLPVSGSPFPVPDGHGHALRFYEDEAALLEAAAAFLSAGLAAGEAAFAILSPAHRQALTQALPARGIDPAAALASGQLVLRDAGEIHDLFRSPSGWPDEDRFMRGMGGMIAKASVGRPALRAFVGMLDLLPSGGDAGAAALEGLWNKLGRTLAFSLLCAYPMRAFRGAPESLFERICGEHDAVIPCESFRTDVPEAARLRQVAELQRRLAALEAEREATLRHEKAEEQARQARSLEAVGRLAGGLAHDFNNLLTAINGYSEISLSLAPAEGPLRDFLAEIKRAGERASDLTRQLLAYGRRQIMAPVAFDLDGTLDDMGRMLRRLLGKAIRIERQRQAGLGRILADPGQVQQIILNLAINAREAMPAGGSLVFATADVVPAPGPDREAKPYVMLSVKDSGPGMDAEVKARVFDPFFTTKSAAGSAGVGLGLSCVYGIVRQSGGFITVESEPGRGSEFRVHFPWLEPEGPAEAGTGSAGIALVAASDAAMRRFLARTLASEGYSVAEAEDGAAAAASGSDAPRLDLLIAEDPCQGMLAPMLAERLRARHPGLRTIYLPDPAAGATEAPALERPFTRADLIASIRKSAEAAA